jgi:hypothetical protein
MHVKLLLKQCQPIECCIVKQQTLGCSRVALQVVSAACCNDCKPCWLHPSPLTTHPPQPQAQASASDGIG